MKKEIKQISKRIDKAEGKIKELTKKIGRLHEEIIIAGKNPKGKRTKCQKCNYEWRSKSRMKYASCPKCMAKVKTDRIDSFLKKLEKAREKEDDRIVDKAIKEIEEENKKYPSNIDKILGKI